MSEFVALFTGQGSQFAGMGSELYESSEPARDVFDEAESVLPGIRALCFEGPDNELVLTENTQRAVQASNNPVKRGIEFFESGDIEAKGIDQPLKVIGVRPRG